MKPTKTIFACLTAVMAVGTEESEFKANEKIIDEIWGSFSMQSGGASGKS